MKTTLFTLLLLSTISSGQWKHQGTPICTATGDQTNPVVVSDAKGGAFIAWIDGRDLGGAIYAQRVTADGKIFWAENGIKIASNDNSMSDLHVCADGVGGVIFAWQDKRTGGVGVSDVYAQRIDSNGATKWTANGVKVCGAAEGQFEVQICSDGVQGAYIKWRDERDQSQTALWDLYMQHLNASGAPTFAADGINITNAPESFTGNATNGPIFPDGKGGAFLGYSINDDFIAGGDAYAQRVKPDGSLYTSKGTGIPLGANHLYITEGRAGAAANGGGIAGWRDNRYFDGTLDAFVQKVDSLGALVWTTPNGVEAIRGCDQTTFTYFLGSTYLLNLVDDNRGGIFAIVAADTIDSVSCFIRARRVNSAGIAQGTNLLGTALTKLPSYAKFLDLLAIPDLQNGAYVGWKDMRNANANIFAMRADSSANPLWTANGVAICDTIGDQALPSLLPVQYKTQKGLLITWQDNRDSTISNNDIYAYAILDNGSGPIIGDALPPIVHSIDPDSGKTTEATPVTIIGANFLGATGVALNDAASTALVGTLSVDALGTKITGLRVPSGVAVGKYNVKVTTPVGTNLTSDTLFTVYSDSASQFLPIVHSIHPDSGINTAATPVTIVGLNFLGATAVKLTDPAATALIGAIIVNGAGTEITGLSVPPGVQVGKYNVRVTTPAGTNTTSDTLFTVYSTIGVHDGRGDISSLWLGQNHPNPAGSVTFIPYETGNELNVHLAVTDMLGQVLLNVPLDGNHLYELSTGSLPAGMYRYELVTGSGIRRSHMMSVIH